MDDVIDSAALLSDIYVPIGIIAKKNAPFYS